MFSHSFWKIKINDVKIIFNTNAYKNKQSVITYNLMWIYIISSVIMKFVLLKCNKENREHHKQLISIQQLIYVSRILILCNPIIQCSKSSMHFFNVDNNTFVLLPKFVEFLRCSLKCLKRFETDKFLWNGDGTCW